MLIIMHYALFISHYAGFGTQSKLSNFWVTGDSLWVEPLLTREMCNVQTLHLLYIDIIAGKYEFGANQSMST